ncbi:MAG: nucleoside triphosphate pyrophosphohydrolase family protein [Candidatus Thiodiazotropha taylori]
MQAKEYQIEAKRTSRINWENKNGPDVAVLGIIGEIGSLASVIKKHQRDGEYYASFEEDFLEESGDVLWYVTTIATRVGLTLDNWPSVGATYADMFAGLYGLHRKIVELTSARDVFVSPRVADAEELKPLIFDILADLQGMLDFRSTSLADIAQSSCDKILSYWCEFSKYPARSFDSKFPWYEQLPRKFTVDFIDIVPGETLIMILNGMQIGDRLTDNSYMEDGYRFHDVFHLAGAVTLGWSPVFRRMIKAKRKSDKQKDEVEDGARAAIIEEAVINHIYDYARPKFLKGMKRVDLDLIKRIQNLVRGYEVQECEPWEWQYCILKSYEMFRLLIEHGGGRLYLNADERSMQFQPLDKEYSEFYR